ncbi:MAG: hypothetical protein HY892_22390 [Deltaproteobacteria bacterium]|nr:hypothetical protein [Deltaproteobacteria bacterium]
MARFDRVIPPGGEGKAVLKVDLKGYQGKVRKSATVFSNDPQQPNFTLTVMGQVRPFIEVKPGSSIQFSSAPSPDEKIVELLAVDREFKVVQVENGLEGKIRTQLETVVPGKQYRLRVINLQKEGNYFGLVRCRTDHPQKPEIQIRISGHFPKPQPKTN